MNIIDVGLKFNSNMSKMGIVEGIGLHHSGVAVLQNIEVIHKYHKSKGWARYRVSLLCKKRWKCL